MTECETEKELRSEMAAMKFLSQMQANFHEKKVQDIEKSFSAAFDANLADMRAAHNFDYMEIVTATLKFHYRRMLAAITSASCSYACGMERHLEGVDGEELTRRLLRHLTEIYLSSTEKDVNALEHQAVQDYYEIKRSMK